MKPTDQNWYVLDNPITGAWNYAPGKNQFVAPVMIRNWLLDTGITARRG